MRTGRPPKPTALKVIAGTDQPCRMRDDEPKPKADRIRKPTGMSRKAHKYWNKIEPMLMDCRVLTNIDTVALAMLCTSIAEMFELQKQLDDTGMLIKGRGGIPVISPLFRALRAKQADVHKMLVEFGMTPSSRTRVGTVGEKESKDEWDF